MDQNKREFCNILDKLGDEIIEMVDFYGEAKTMAELMLGSKYENTCYYTEVDIDINNDYIATVYQNKKAGLRKEDFLPNVIYPKSKTWDLSKDEVSFELTEIILPRFEKFLAKIKDGFEALQKLKLDNSTRTEAFGVLKHLHKVGVSLVANFKKDESTLLFVRDFKNYFSDCCEVTMLCRRLEELQMRMGIEPVKQKKDKSSIVKDKFSFPLGQVLYEGKDLNIPTGEALDVLKKLVDKLDSVIPYQDLEDSSVNSATDILRGIVQKINQQLKLHKVPCFISPKRTVGYILNSKNSTL